MAYVLANDPTVDERYVAFSVLVKNMDERQRMLFSRDLTLFSDLRREGLPYRALDALMSTDDGFAVSRAAFHQTIVDYCQKRSVIDAQEFFTLTNAYEKERKTLMQRSAQMVATANAAIAEYVEYAFCCAEEGENLDLLQIESMALSRYGAAVRRFDEALRGLPALPVSEGSTSYQLMLALAAGALTFALFVTIISSI